MDWKNQLAKTPVLIFFVIFGAVVVSTAYALVTITLAGDVIIEGDTQMDGNLRLDGGHSGISWNSRIPATNINNLVDSEGNVGSHTSITIGVDGLPVISYHDSTNDDLKVAKCHTKSCSSSTITTVDSSGDVGQYSSIAIGTDGNPVISYYDGSPNSDLKVVVCGNTSCTAGNTITTLDSVDSVGQFTSIIIDSFNRPAISYFDITNTALKLVVCSNSSCTGGNSITTIDNSGQDGRYSSIALGPIDGNLVISYQHDLAPASLKVAYCGNSFCTAGNTITTVDSTDNVGYFTSITIGNDGSPVISYYDITNEVLKFLDCGSFRCDSGNVITSFSGGDDKGRYSSVAIGSDLNPVISHFDNTVGFLLVTKCYNPSCTVSSTKILDAGGDSGEFTSIAIGVDGLPVISYYDTGTDDLRVAKCENITCQNYWTRR